MSQNQSETPVVKLTVARKGPLRVANPDGLISIEWSDGEAVTPPNPKMFALCRCGASSTQPFCDGTHEITKDEDADKLYWYDEDGGRHEIAETYDEMTSEM